MKTSKKRTGTDVHKATRKSRSSESKLIVILLIGSTRGGIAVVWLGKQLKTQKMVAMKQFPKSSAKPVDSSAYVEL